VHGLRCRLDPEGIDVFIFAAQAISSRLLTGVYGKVVDMSFTDWRALEERDVLRVVSR
jgi:hypothetical protein